MIPIEDTFPAEVKDTELVTRSLCGQPMISRITNPNLLPLLSLSLVVVSLGRGQDPARGGATGGRAAENSHGSPDAQLKQLKRIGPRPAFADLAYANE